MSKLAREIFVSNVNDKLAMLGGDYTAPTLAGAGVAGLGLGGLGIAGSIQAATAYNNAIQQQLMRASMEAGKAEAALAKSATIPALLAQGIAEGRGAARINALKPALKYGIPGAVALGGAALAGYGLYKRANQPWYERMWNRITD